LSLAHESLGGSESGFAASSAKGSRPPPRGQLPLSDIFIVLARFQRAAGSGRAERRANGCKKKALAPTGAPQVHVRRTDLQTLHEGHRTAPMCAALYGWLN
jgi:hypothetical protein